VAEIDPSESAPEVKVNPPFPRPFIRRGEMYFLEDLLHWFSEKTVAGWKQINPNLVRQPGTRRAFIISDDLFDIFADRGIS
jgi:hypothetical protein